MEKGRFKIIRTDGTETDIEGKPTIRDLYAAIGCTCADTVTLDHKKRTVMFVDDTGMIDGKPVNGKATALYHSVCRPGTLHQIHGDVAIVNDRDFV
jgi:hypothetical protein